MINLEDYLNSSSEEQHIDNIILDHISPNVKYKPTGEIGTYSYMRFEGDNCKSQDCFIKGSKFLIVKLEDIEF